MSIQDVASGITGVEVRQVVDKQEAVSLQIQRNMPLRGGS
jgi:hypothetical protein